jgi:lipoate-protein ligase A
MIPLELIHFKNKPILSQLYLEEALLRADNKNYCLINQGSCPSIVMGISAKKEQVIHDNNHLSIIRRFSGGGTVVVDESTLFITFIFNQKDTQVPLQPEAIMRWTEPIYQQVFGSIDFKLKENDYVIEEKKCGGNAQYLCKDRFLHHTSFLWDFKQENMNLLKFPPKTPSYRSNRSHRDFLCTLNEYFDSQETLINSFKQVLEEKFRVIASNENEHEEILNRPHRRATIVLE